MQPLDYAEIKPDGLTPVTTWAATREGLTIYKGGHMVAKIAPHLLIGLVADIMQQVVRCPLNR